MFGRDWFTRGDGFGAYSSLLARLCPAGRRGDGTLVWRTPLTGLMTGAPNPASPPPRACSSAPPGSTASPAPPRRDNVDPSSVSAGTLGLAAAIGAVTLLYVAALRLSARLTGQDPAVLPGRFAATLLPIALGYTLAHYFSFFVLEGQTTFILASDPFGTGADLLGSTGNRIDYGLAGPVLTAQVQVNAIVLGHIAGTIAAHDLALRGPGPALRGQLLVAAVMVALTCAGLFALLSG